MVDIPGVTINQKLAEGACAEIYSGVDQSTGRLVAIKILHRKHHTNKAEYKRLSDEGALGMRLAQHDNIVQTFRTGMAGTMPYIVLEYVDGTTLRVLLRKKKKFNDFEVLKLAKGLARGLRFLHDAGVCHKDLKPDNIMVNQEGVVKLLDFGFAENVNSFKLFGRHLEGSPPYMAPELFATRKPTPATDIYALGCTLYECATGIQPFAGMSDTETSRKQMNLKLAAPPIRDAAPGISVYTEKTILTAVEKDPVRRFKSADEILLDLARNPGTRDSRFITRVPTPR